MQSVTREQVEYFEGEDVTCKCSVFIPYHVHTVNEEVFPIQPHFYSVLEEEMTPNSRGRHTFKDFEHYKAFRSVGGPAMATKHFWYRGRELEPHLFFGPVSASRSLAIGPSVNGAGVHPFGEPGLPLNGLPGFRVPRSDGGFVPAPDDLGSLLQRAYRTMMPQIKAQLSLVNSVIELKDFVSLPKLLKEIGRFAIKRASRTLRELLRLGADGYLQSEFNIRPLLSDIVGLWTALSTVEQRLRKLINNSGAPQKAHFSWVFEEFVPHVTDYSDSYLAFTVPPFQGAYLPFTFYRMSRDVKYDDSIFHAEVKYNYSFTPFQLEHARVLSLLDAFGVNLNPAIIWNAIPWSFVVDWVIGVGQWLNSRKVLNMEPKINILDSLWSIKRVRTVTTRILTESTGFPGVPSRFPEVMMPQVRETAYRRGTGIVSSSLLETSGLSAKEFSLGAALVIARRRRPSR